MGKGKERVRVEEKTFKIRFKMQNERQRKIISRGLDANNNDESAWSLPIHVLLYVCIYVLYMYIFTSFHFTSL